MVSSTSRVAFALGTAQVFEWLAEYMDGSREVSTLETKEPKHLRRSIYGGVLK